MRVGKVGVLLSTMSVALALLSLGLWARASRAVRGCTEGFDCVGTYVSDGSAVGVPWLTVEGEEGVSNGAGALSWTLFYSHGSAGGVLEPTADPNVYTLRDRDGGPVGSAHMAYGGGASGVLYLTLGDAEAVRMGWTDRVPTRRTD